MQKIGGQDRQADLVWNRALWREVLIADSADSATSGVLNPLQCTDNLQTKWSIKVLGNANYEMHQTPKKSSIISAFSSLCVTNAPKHLKRQIDAVFLRVHLGAGELEKCPKRQINIRSLGGESIYIGIYQSILVYIGIDIGIYWCRKSPSQRQINIRSLGGESMRRTDLLYCPQLRCRPTRGQQ